MPTFKISTTIKKPAETVWQALVEPENKFFWMTGLMQFEIVEGNYGEPGTLARLYYNNEGIIYTLEERLEQMQVGHRIVKNVYGGDFRAREETLLEELGDETEITTLCHCSGSNLLSGFSLILMKKEIKKKAAKDLDKFRKLVEKHGSKFTNI